MDSHEDRLLEPLEDPSELELFSNMKIGPLAIKTAGSFAELQNELASATPNDIIQITADFDFTDSLDVTESVTIEGAAGIYTLKRASGFIESMFKVQGGKSLTLQNITLDGNKSVVTAERPLVSVFDGGGLTIDTGGTLQNNNNGTTYGGGVYIDDGSCEVLAGGTIAENDATNNPSGFGGGIYLYQGEVNLNGGIISNNTALRGGGIYVGYQLKTASFVMAGGTISDNSVTVYGGGIYMNEGSTALHTGGIITGNKTTGTGSGQGSGAGVFVNNSVYELQSNAQIKLNNAAVNGGGIYVTDGGNLTVTDSVEISFNAAAYGGGGVYVNGTGQFAMDDGTINKNQARFGGGVFINSSKFVFSDGVIAENTAVSGPTYGGGGIHMANGSFDMSGGVITGNTAPNQTGSGLNLINGTVMLSDLVKIGSHPLDNGVYLENGKTLTIADSGLSPGSHVNIEKTAAAAVTGLAVAVQSPPGTITSAEAEYFLYQPGGFIVRERPSSTNTYELYASPTLVVHPSVLDFGSQQEGSASAEQIVTVIGTNLTNDISLNLPLNFSVTKDVDWDDRTGGTLKITFVPTSAANYNETLIVSSIGTVSQTVELTGIGVAAPPDTYTLTMVSGTDNTAAGPYTQGTTVSITADPAPNGQAFDYWSSSGGGSFADANSVTTTFTMPAANVTVTANYKTAPLGTYTVTYAMGGASGGNVPIDNNTYTSGSIVIVQGNTGNPTLSGYRFSGWKNSADNQIYAVGQTFIITTHVTLTAQWESIDNNSDGGRVGPDNAAPQTGNNQDSRTSAPSLQTEDSNSDGNTDPDNLLPQAGGHNRVSDANTLSPQTGDNSNLGLWTTILISSVLLLCGMVIWPKYSSEK